MTAGDGFLADLETLGFRWVQQNRQGVVQLSKEVSRYLTFWVHWTPEEEQVLFTWEMAVGEFMDAHELQIGSNEPLNQYLFPKYDARGPQDAAFVVAEMDRAEALLASLNLFDGSRKA